MIVLQILLAEDNRADVLLVRESLRAYGVLHQLHVVEDGGEALAFLAHAVENGGSAQPRPDLLLLDLDLPRVDGSQVLQEIRANAELAELPVIIVSSSDAPGDRESVAKLGISAYFYKPCDLDGFLELGAVVRDTIPEVR